MSIQSLNQAEILDKINNNNVSQIFLKEKNFTVRAVNVVLLCVYAWCMLHRILKKKTTAKNTQ